MLKPDVVFFGENVPAARVERCYAAVDALGDRDGALLVAGSSLTVMSGLRFVKRAARAGTPGGDRQPRRDPRRRPRDVQARRSGAASSWRELERRGWLRGCADEDVLGGLGDDLGGLAAGADQHALGGGDHGDGLVGQGADAAQRAHQHLVLLHLLGDAADVHARLLGGRRPRTAARRPP